MNAKELLNALKKMNAEELLNALNTTIPKLKEKEPNLEIKAVEYYMDVIANKLLILIRVVYPSGDEKVVAFDTETLKVLKVEPVKGANDEL